MITYVLLTRDNYNEWSSEMLNAFSAKKKVGFVDGSIAKPDTAGAELESWTSVNSMVIGWLRTSITPRVQSTVLFLTSAHELWENSRKRFSVGNKVRVHHLRAQLTACRQDGQSVIDYYGRMAAMWDELYAYKPILACTCGASAKFAKKREEEKVQQFIICLDESRFPNVITSIIDVDPSPDLEHVYSRVIREEHMLTSSKSRESADVVGFATRGDVPGSELRVYPVGNKSRDRLLCSHCGHSGHEKALCWKLIGYHEWVTERNAHNGGRGSNRGGRGSSGSTKGRGKALVNVAQAPSSQSSVFLELTAISGKPLVCLLKKKNRVCGERQTLG